MAWLSTRFLIALYLCSKFLLSCVRFSTRTYHQHRNSASNTLHLFSLLNSCSVHQLCLRNKLISSLFTLQSLFSSVSSPSSLSHLSSLSTLFLSTLYSLFPCLLHSQNSSHFTHYNNPLTLFTDNAFTHYNSNTLLQCCYTKGEHTDSVGLNY